MAVESKSNRRCSHRLTVYSDRDRWKANTPDVDSDYYAQRIYINDDVIACLESNNLCFTHSSIVHSRKTRPLNTQTHNTRTSATGKRRPTFSVTVFYFIFCTFWYKKKLITSITFWLLKARKLEQFAGDCLSDLRQSVTRAKEVMFSPEYVCLSVNRINQKLLISLWLVRHPHT